MDLQLVSAPKKTPLQQWEIDDLNEREKECAKALTRLATAIFKIREVGIPDWQSPLSIESFHATQAALALHDLRGLAVYDSEDTCEVLGKIVGRQVDGGYDTGSFVLDTGWVVSSSTAHLGLHVPGELRYDELDVLLALMSAKPLGPYGYNDKLREQELADA